MVRSLLLATACWASLAVSAAPADPPSPDLAQLSARLEEIETQMAALQREVSAMKRDLAGRLSVPKDVVAGEPARGMAEIYQAIRIVNASTTGGPYSPGDTVKISYQFVNASKEGLKPPLDDSYSQPFHLIGTRQHWIERLGDESTIGAIPARIARQGRKYAAGGAIIPTGPELAPGQTLGFTARLMTEGYPPGKYQFEIQYKDKQGEVLQAEVVRFELLVKESSDKH